MKTIKTYSKIELKKLDNKEFKKHSDNFYKKTKDYKKLLEIEKESRAY